jgi:hypothetical protein
MDIPDLADSRVRRVNPDEIDAIFAETEKLIATLRGTQTLVSPETFWNVFYSRFPQSSGYLVLSAPAFDSERRQAVVLSDHMYASLGGQGLLLLFVRDDAGKWTIKARLPRWVS